MPTVIVVDVDVVVYFVVLVPANNLLLLRQLIMTSITKVV